MVDEKVCDYHEPGQAKCRQMATHGVGGNPRSMDAKWFVCSRHAMKRFWPEDLRGSIRPLNPPEPVLDLGLDPL
jgi:hypothetical protein